MNGPENDSSAYLFIECVVSSFAEGASEEIMIYLPVFVEEIDTEMVIFDWYKKNVFIFRFYQTSVNFY